MCGIAGSFHDSPTAPSGPRLMQMLERMKHRGDCPPAVVEFRCGSLGCVRLAIVDRAKGGQPLSDSSGRYTVVFNGEIYNHKELREQLRPYPFATDCDTEVLLAGYLKWGEELVRHLHGMYAFILLDSETGTFLAARDRLGIKPLYYLRDGNSWTFASEIKALLAPDLRNAKEIHIVPPSSVVTRSGIRTGTGLPATVEVPADWDEAKKQLRLLLGDAVRRMLDTDLDVAVLLSGGVDSSVLLYEAVRQSREIGRSLDTIRAYCVGTDDVPDDQDWPDLRFARMAADHIGVGLTEVPIRIPDMVDLVREVIYSLESFEPNHIRAGTAHYALTKQLHEDGIKVLLCGEGADELLGGYEEFLDSVRHGGYLPDLEKTFTDFVGELHRTQLQRVDRLSLAWGIEARVPYLYDPVADFLWSLPPQWKVAKDGNDKFVGKHILRAAYRGYLPDEVVNRRKVPMGEGAGVGDNCPSGPFYTRAESLIGNDSLTVLKNDYPDFRLANKEEAWYFRTFLRKFGELMLASNRPPYKRPRTNLQPTQ